MYCMLISYIQAFSKKNNTEQGALQMSVIIVVEMVDKKRCYCKINIWSAFQQSFGTCEGWKIYFIIFSLVKIAEILIPSCE